MLKEELVDIKSITNVEVYDKVLLDYYVYRENFTFWQKVGRFLILRKSKPGWYYIDYEPFMSLLRATETYYTEKEVKNHDSCQERNMILGNKVYRRAKLILYCGKHRTVVYADDVSEFDDTIKQLRKSDKFINIKIK